MTPTFTLRAIRDVPGNSFQDSWKRLCKNIGTSDLSTVITLGDVAASNNAADAWWCVHALDWSNIAIRRSIIGALIPSLQRAAALTANICIRDCLKALKQSCAGDDLVDLRSAEKKARRVADAAMAPQTMWAARAVYAAIWAAAESAVERGVDGASCAGAYAAAAISSAEATTWAAKAAEAKEFEAQRADLIAAFPPMVLKEAKP